ncbi:hypothetical protein NL676_008642 [Syzygium grande]|nr:hypothetical protein NL676_008642 [Syzygium grande]
MRHGMQQDMRKWKLLMFSFSTALSIIDDKFGGCGSILLMHLSSFKACISSKASQVGGYSGFSLDVPALVLPVEFSHGFAQLGKTFGL